MKTETKLNPQAVRLELSRLEKMKVKRWYLQEDHTASEIASRLDIPQLVRNVTQLLYIQGWTKIKKRQRALVSIDKSEVAPLNKEEEEEVEKAQAFKDQSEELLEKSFKMGREAVDAKTLREASSATKNYMDTYGRAKLMSSPVLEIKVAIGVGLFTVGEEQKASVLVTDGMKIAQPIDSPPLTSDIGI